MPNTHLSLREISRRLGIPPSSVVYYKDRFAAYIPNMGGKGRRVTYPPEAITVFKEIREMFDNSWSAEQIERDLARRFNAVLKDGAYGFRNDELLNNERPGSDPESQAVVQGLTGVLDKMSSLLENQNLFRAEIESLRQEILGLKAEKMDLERQYREKLALLEQEVEELRKERAELARRFMEHISHKEEAESRSRRTTPPDAFLRLPLVIRTEHGEYLGVAGKTKHFSLKEFIRIIQKNGQSNKTVSLEWQSEGAKWTLRIATLDAGGQASHEHILEVSETLTPSKNRVVQLTKLRIDGNAVPDPFLLVLFRKIKDGFDD